MIFWPHPWLCVNAELSRPCRYRSSVLKTLSSSAEEEVSNEKQFLAILEAIGQSFLQPDINVFKLNLATLQMLNTKWKLFHKVRLEVWGKSESLQALHPVQCFFLSLSLGAREGALLVI